MEVLHETRKIAFVSPARQIPLDMIEEPGAIQRAMKVLRMLYILQKRHPESPYVEVKADPECPTFAAVTSLAQAGLVRVCAWQNETGQKGVACTLMTLEQADAYGKEHGEVING